MRKIAWILGFVGLAALVLGKLEARRARLDAELWAEATDPLP